MRVVLAIYLVGVAVGLLRTDGRALVRVLLALAWPIGPLAFVLTVTLLVTVSLAIFPLAGAAVALGAAGAWWAFG